MPSIVPMDQTIDLGPIARAIAARLDAVLPNDVQVLYGDTAPTDANAKRVSINLRGNPASSYGEPDIACYLDIACTTPGRDTTPVYLLARQVQQAIMPPASPVAPADTYRPLDNVMVTGIVSRDPPPEAGKTVRVLLISFQLWAEHV